MTAACHRSIVTRTSPPMQPKVKTAKPSRKVLAAGPDDKKARKSRRVYNFDYNFLSQFFHMPQRQAAQLLDVAVITIKRCCKREGFKWPYRANKYKCRNKPVRSVKGRAFHELPLDCMKAEVHATAPVPVPVPQQAASECDTDTESVDVDDEEQVKKNFCEIVFMLNRSAPPCERLVQV
ncbi:hypothetical protein PHYPSEUDO_011735 [Phytophthora pseudosyringae]|uniref:RWP-RK domain-containing protein n=1 Tax=Phytophthora pseudosyringae TaxID=221518 RepID=A0A8T1VBB7_9STRA|nr:hypothetical protein PHYPSEUDO_011735 [Phytophthora pseudosyringae]